MKLLTPYFLASIFLFLIGCKNDVSKVPEGFEIMEGYDLELVASEPLIADPVDLEFDENGDFYVKKE